MSELPPGWEWTTLQELAAAEPRAMTDGPFGSNLKSTHYVDSGPRVIRLQNIGFGEFVDEKAHITESHFETLRAHEARSGDLVVASLGQDLPRACLVPPNLGPAIVKADCVRVRLHPSVDARYLNYALQRPDLRHAVADQIHGVGRPRLGMAGIKELSIPLPPRQEQKRIVAAIEEHLTRLDAAQSAVRSARQRLEAFRAAVVDEAFRELADAPEQSGREIFSYITSGSRGWAKYYAPSGALFLRVGNVPRIGVQLDLSDAQRVEPPDGAEGRRTRVEPGDLLITITADTGRVAVCPPGLEPAYINQHVALARPNDGLDSHYLAWFLSSSVGQRQVRELQRGATKAGLGLDDIRSLRFKTPGLERQREIAAELAGAQDRAASLSFGLQRLATTTALRRSILTAAFSGELVPQDPDEEPASALLERIRAERGAAGPVKRFRKAKAS